VSHQRTLPSSEAVKHSAPDFPNQIKLFTASL
jgi:hypothetical protein